MLSLKKLAMGALFALSASQFPQEVDAAAALVKGISDNDTTTTYSSLNPQVRTVTRKLRSTPELTCRCRISPPTPAIRPARFPYAPPSFDMTSTGVRG
jgi:hypothetical protein